MRTVDTKAPNCLDRAPRRWWSPMAQSFAALALVGTVGVPAASAAVIHDSTGSYSAGGFYLAIYEDAICDTGDCFATAQDFDVVADHTLTSIGIPLSVFPGSPNKVRITLYGASTGLPGAVLESWLVVGQMPTTGTANTSLLTVTSLLNPLLSQGSRYFVGFDVPETSSFFVYSPSSALVETATVAHTFDHGATWSTRFSGTRDGLMAFRVEGDLVQQPVPAPATVALAVLGLALLGAGRRRR